MADAKISELPAVTTPVSTDEFAVNQTGTTRKQTRAQVHALESGEHFILPQVNEESTPTLAFGDGDTGWFESTDDTLSIAISGSRVAFFNTTSFTISGVNRPALRDQNTSATEPNILPDSADTDTGLGSDAANKISLIAGGVEGMRFTGDTTDIIIAYEANVGLTANANSSQGDTPLTSSKNVISTVGTIGDAVTLPATFIQGTEIYVQNDGANSMDVFPATGDTITPNAVNIAEAVAAGVGALFIATTADSVWSRMRLN